MYCIWNCSEYDSGHHNIIKNFLSILNPNIIELILVMAPMVGTHIKLLTPHIPQWIFFFVPHTGIEPETSDALATGADSYFKF